MGQVSYMPIEAEKAPQDASSEVQELSFDKPDADSIDRSMPESQESHEKLFGKHSPKE